MKKILFIVGSMRKKSFNKQRATIVAEELNGKAEVSFLSYGDIPFMNQDIEFPTPEEIIRVRGEVENADGLWIFTPEYNYSYPGVLKNLLDWLSRPLIKNDPERKSSVKGKKVAISGVAGKSVAAGSRGKLKDLLEIMGMKIMETQVGITINSEAWANDELTISNDKKEELKKQAEEFLKFLDEE